MQTWHIHEWHHHLHYKFAMNVAYFLDDDPDDQADGSFAGEQSIGSGARALKALRLVRLSKMLRIARIKR